MPGLNIVLYSYFAPLRNICDGGAQRLIDGFLRYLTVEDGVARVTVVCSRPGNRTPLRESPTLKLRYLRDPVDALPSTPENALHDRLLLTKAAEAADVVITLDRPLPVRTRTPTVLCLNNLSYGPETAAAFSGTWDAAVVPSIYLKGEINGYLGTHAWDGPPPPIHVIPPGLIHESEHPRRLTSAHSPVIRLCFPHRPDPGKGFMTAVNALRILLDRGHKCTLTVPMPHPDALWPHQREHLRRQEEAIRELHLEGDVERIPWISAERIAACLAKFDVCLAPSLLPESFGLTVVESLAAGTPVIATRAGAYPELVPSRHGIIFVDRHSPDQIADAVLHLPPAAEMATVAEYLAHRYTWPAAIQQWFTVLTTTQKISSYCTYARSD